MTVSQARTAAGLVRTTRRRGFCPACRGWVPGVADRPGSSGNELSPPALTVLAFLVVAVAAWAVTFRQARSADGMAMGLGTLGPFAAGWAVMMQGVMVAAALA